MGRFSCCCFFPSPLRWAREIREFLLSLSGEVACETNRRSWGTEFVCGIVIALSEQCHCRAETLNANNGKPLVLLLEISRFPSSALALFMVTDTGMLTPKAAGGTWLRDPLRAASPFNLLSSTDWATLL